MCPFAPPNPQAHAAESLPAAFPHVLGAPPLRSGNLSGRQGPRSAGSGGGAASGAGRSLSPSGCLKVRGAGWAGASSATLSPWKRDRQAQPSCGALAGGQSSRSAPVPQLNWIQLLPRNLTAAQAFLGQSALPTTGSPRPAAGWRFGRSPRPVGPGRAVRGESGEDAVKCGRPGGGQGWAVCSQRPGVGAGPWDCGAERAGPG